MATKISIKIDGKTIKAAGDFVNLIWNFGKEVKQNRPQNHTPTRLEIHDPYEVLGISQDATLEQIKQRYRDLAKVYHPDKQNGDTKAMAKLNQAYQQICQERS